MLHELGNNPFASMLSNKSKHCHAMAEATRVVIDQPADLGR
jgi:hypothetical protein